MDINTTGVGSVLRRRQAITFPSQVDEFGWNVCLQTNQSISEYPLVGQMVVFAVPTTYAQDCVLWLLNWLGKIYSEQRNTTGRATIRRKIWEGPSNRWVEDPSGFKLMGAINLFCSLTGRYDHGHSGGLSCFLMWNHCGWGNAILVRGNYFLSLYPVGSV